MTLLEVLTGVEQLSDALREQRYEAACSIADELEQVLLDEVYG